MPQSARSLNLADAKTMITAGERQAAALSRAYNIAVVDSGGNLLAHVRMDGAWIGSVDIAINKAWTAAAFSMSTEALGRLAQDGKPGFGLNTTNHSRVVIFGGGIPVLEGDMVIGAVGASGSSVENDIVVARAALNGLSRIPQE